MLEVWENKLKDNFGTAVVDKKAALENEVKDLPRYVSEYLLGYFCDDGVTEENLKQMHSYIRDCRIDGRAKEKARHMLQTSFRMKVIDKFRVKINLTNKNKPENSLQIPSMGIDDAQVFDSILKDNERLLIDGLWGLGEVKYDPELKSIELIKFKPFQLANINVDDFIEVRSQFSREGWINALVSTIGLNHKAYSTREKFILISRLLPMVENNLFMMEFGPPGTGKTYAFENLSSYSRVISGSKVTAPQLFYNLNNNQAGLLLQYDVILFDEIDKVKSTGIDEEVVNKLYQYLASGKFDRGGVEKNSNCGIVMVGNLPKGKLSKREMLDQLLHERLKHAAFLDRLAGVIPGWDLEGIKDSSVSLTKHYGFTADYFSEILNRLRRENYDYVLNRIDLKNAGIRDESNIKRMVSAFIKLIYPDGKINKEELKEITEYAVEYRQFVIDQNYYINGKEDYNKRIEFEIK
ncbi:BREX system Lon protease-like protein BrxL [Orenia marismortui]|uniref:ATP-dependent Lon protease n=1 Tax=Orenia marismortui TaxID=46469 RepID=A0A4R8H1C2_9FIRM|nr:BREX system Lon protease-like protein BrxL [Orenia marismortui]TDX53234.1 ATP-dependent Lon protease [Orenia marismortui]